MTNPHLDNPKEKYLEERKPAIDGKNLKLQSKSTNISGKSLL